MEFNFKENVLGRWDRLHINQVVTNLLRNAIKYGSGKLIEVSVAHKKNQAVITIKDHGIGIKPEDQKRIFRPYERAVSVYSYGGFGMVQDTKFQRIAL